MGDFNPFSYYCVYVIFIFLSGGKKSRWDFFSLASPLLGMAAFMEQKLPTKKDVLQWG